MNANLNMRATTLINGLGQAGGNICEEAERIGGYNTFAMNSSLGDLSTLKLVKQVYHLEGGQGANHDRRKSKMLLYNDRETAINRTLQCITSKTENIIVVGAAGGGTASGAMAMYTDCLVKKIRALGLNINVCVALILPSLNESFKAQYNALMCLEEIRELSSSIGAIFLLDNNQVKNKMTVNSRFIKQLSMFLDIPSSDSSIIKTIDKNEITEVLSARNIAMITTASDKKNVSGEILKSLNSNIYAPIEGIGSRFGYLTLSLDNNNNVINSEDVVLELKKTLGQSIDDYVTFNKRNMNICCISGLPFPEQRIKMISDIVSESASDVRNLLTSKVEKPKIEKNLKELFSFNSPVVEKNENQSDNEFLNDVMSKYL